MRTPGQLAEHGPGCCSGSVTAQGDVGPLRSRVAWQTPPRPGQQRPGPNPGDDTHGDEHPTVRTWPDDNRCRRDRAGLRGRGFRRRPVAGGAGGEHPHRPWLGVGFPAGRRRSVGAQRGSGHGVELADAPAGRVLVDHRRHRRRTRGHDPRDRRIHARKDEDPPEGAGVGRPARDGENSKT